MLKIKNKQLFKIVSGVEVSHSKMTLILKIHSIEKEMM